MGTSKTPGWFLFVLGIVYPAGVIGFELIQKWCAEAFFDPMPSVWHVILVSMVPVTSFLVWLHLRDQSRGNVRLLSFLAALSIGVAACYTILFLPLTPLAVVAIVFYGIGLLPLAPLVSLIVAIVLYWRLRSAIVAEGKQPVNLWKGLAVAVLTVLILDIPSIATQQGILMAASGSEERSLRGVQLLRTLGDEDSLLRRCYDQSGTASGPTGMVVSWLFGNGDKYIPTSKVREIYYRVTGEPFNMRPPPYTGGQWQRMGGFEFDSDLGGTDVGGRVKGLHLVASRIDGSMSGDDGVAYLEWTLEFRNDSSIQREVRLQIALPPESVTSRATLWINDEEREAAFAGRGQATQAYQSVVQRQRDPLLVTTRGADRLQAQAFPLPPNGGTIKFRLGITAPLEILNEEQMRLVLPAIVDRNFVIGSKVTHTIWVESEQSLQTTLPDAEIQAVAGSVHRVTATLDDAALSQSRSVIFAQRSDKPAERWAAIEGQVPVVQKLISRIREPVDALMIVLDGSANAEQFVPAIAEALEQIPPSARVGLIIAGARASAVSIEEWSPLHKQELLETMSSHDFVGGQDNMPSLSKALRELERYENGELLWVHLPQPINFEGSSAAFEQTLTRLSKLPRTALYSLRSGPNVLLGNGEWELLSRTVPRVDGPSQDLAAYFSSVHSTVSLQEYVRQSVPDTEGLAKGSDHIARLWARDEIHNLLKRKPDNYRDRAIAIAATYQLVTAISGAVVLENAGQYEDNDLNPVSADSVPTIPEPEQWLLALIVLAMMIWMLKQQRTSRSALVH